MARSEFSSTRNVERYREKMKMELKLVYKSALKDKSSKGKSSKAEKKSSSSSLFDRVYTKAEVGRFDRDAPEYTKPRKSARPLNRGIYYTSADDVGKLASEKLDIDIAKHGIKGTVNDFYDNVGTSK